MIASCVLDTFYANNESVRKTYESFEPLQLQPGTILASSFEMQMGVKSKAKRLFKSVSYSLMISFWSFQFFLFNILIYIFLGIFAKPSKIFYKVFFMKIMESMESKSQRETLLIRLITRVYILASVLENLFHINVCMLFIIPHTSRFNRYRNRY